MCRRVATALTVAAALAFVVDGALGGNHVVPAASAHVGHFHVHMHSHAHSHAPAVASNHQLVAGDAVANADVTADRNGFAPASAPDVGGNCCACACACCAAVLLPLLSAQAAPLLLISNMGFAHRRYGDGIVPEGLRRPPRPLSIA